MIRETTNDAIRLARSTVLSCIDEGLRGPHLTADHRRDQEARDWCLDQELTGHAAEVFTAAFKAEWDERARLARAATGTLI